MILFAAMPAACSWRVNSLSRLNSNLGRRVLSAPQARELAKINAVAAPLEIDKLWPWLGPIYDRIEAAAQSGNNGIKNPHSEIPRVDAPSKEEMAAIKKWLERDGYRVVRQADGDLVVRWGDK